MVKILILAIMTIQFLSIVSYSENTTKEAQSADTTENSNKIKVNSEIKHKKGHICNDPNCVCCTDNKKLGKKEQKKGKRNNRISPAAHTSMIVGGTKHKHGFSSKRRNKNGPLKPQTICPIMGGTIDKNIFVDYEGMRIYFCCAGCIYKFNQAPKLSIKTLNRYGEKPEKIEKREESKEKR